MKKYKTIIVIAIIIALIFVAYFLGTLSTYEKVKNMLNDKPEVNNTKNPPTLVVVTNDEDTKYSKISVTYPKINGINAEFSDTISKYVNDSLNEFNINAEENWKARVETSSLSDPIAEFPTEDEKFEFISEWSLSELNEERVSLLLTIYQFSGGAHGSTVMKSFNYDVKENKEITLASLFDNNSSYLEKVSAYSISNLKEQLAGNEMANAESINEGASPKLSNFEIFTVSKNKLTFYFPQYSIGPYALGIKTVEIFNWKD